MGIEGLTYRDYLEMRARLREAVQLYEDMKAGRLSEHERERAIEELCDTAYATSVRVLEAYETIWM